MTKQQTKFIAEVWNYYKTNGRHDLPWRKTTQPYRILVSEMMLQQTQVTRVVPKYQEFLMKFPSTRMLARSSLADVLIAWQGLGYNRRAKLLHQCAKYVIDELHGYYPKRYEDLLTLPGVGPYTAGAVMAFAYNKPVTMIETNLRTVYLHHFFNTKTSVADADLLEIIAATVDQREPRNWYWALMDYGSYLKRTHGNNTTQSRTYIKQSVFKGSDRQIRGAIIRALANKPLTVTELQQIVVTTPSRLKEQLKKLEHESLIEVARTRYHLPQ